MICKGFPFDFVEDWKNTGGKNNSECSPEPDPASVTNNISFAFTASCGLFALAGLCCLYMDGYRMSLR